MSETLSHAHAKRAERPIAGGFSPPDILRTILSTYNRCVFARSGMRSGGHEKIWTIVLTTNCRPHHAWACCSTHAFVGISRITKGSSLACNVQLRTPSLCTFLLVFGSVVPPLMVRDRRGVLSRVLFGIQVLLIHEVSRAQRWTGVHVPVVIEN